MNKYDIMQCGITFLWGNSPLTRLEREHIARQAGVSWCVCVYMWAHDITASSLFICVVKAVPPEAEIMSECHASRAAVVVVVVVLVRFFHSFKCIADKLKEEKYWAANRLSKRSGLACPSMRKGQRASSSSESEESQQPWSRDSRLSSHGCSSAEDSSSDYDVEPESVMKRSQRFNSSFSFGEDQQLQSMNEDRREELLPNSSNGVPVTELVEAELAAECVRLEKQDTFSDINEPPRSSLFRPHKLWLAVTRCISLRWPPCRSINRENNRKLAYQVDHDQSEDTQLSVSTDSTNESSSCTSTSDDRDMTLVKHEEQEDRSRWVNSGSLAPHGVSHSSPRLPRARQAADSVLASMILEKEMFLRIELVDSGEERDDLRYRAEWKLSERTKELAEGVWLSRSLKMTC